MYLIQVFLPLRDNRGKAIPKQQFAELAGELSARFGGLTAYARAPERAALERAFRQDEILIRGSAVTQL